jgi:hypothetical protein
MYKRLCKSSVSDDGSIRAETCRSLYLNEIYVLVVFGEFIIHCFTLLLPVKIQDDSFTITDYPVYFDALRVLKKQVICHITYQFT